MHALAEPNGTVESCLTAQWVMGADPDDLPLRLRCPSAIVGCGGEPILELAVPELEGDTGHTQEPGLLCPVQERTETHRPAAAGSADQDTYVVTSKCAGASRQPGSESERQPDDESGA